MHLFIPYHGMHASLQAEVRKAVTGTNRGKTTTAEQRAHILSLLQQLEALNAVQKPAHSPLLSGWWALLYQGRLLTYTMRLVHVRLPC